MQSPHEALARVIREACDAVVVLEVIDIEAPKALRAQLGEEDWDLAVSELTQVRSSPDSEHEGYALLWRRQDGQGNKLSPCAEGLGLAADTELDFPPAYGCLSFHDGRELRKIRVVALHAHVTLGAKGRIEQLRLLRRWLSQQAPVWDAPVWVAVDSNLRAKHARLPVPLVRNVSKHSSILAGPHFTAPGREHVHQFWLGKAPVGGQSSSVVVPTDEAAAFALSDHLPIRVSLERQARPPPPTYRCAERFQACERRTRAALLVHLLRAKKEN